MLRFALALAFVSVVAAQQQCTVVEGEVYHSGLCTSAAQCDYLISVNDGHSKGESDACDTDATPVCCLFPSGEDEDSVVNALAKPYCSKLNRVALRPLCAAETLTGHCKQMDDNRCLIACSRNSKLRCKTRQDCHEGEVDGAFACLDGPPTPGAPEPSAPEPATHACTTAPKIDVPPAHWHLHQAGFDIKSVHPYGGIYRPLTESEDAAEFTPDMTMASFNGCPVWRYGAVEHAFSAGPAQASLVIADTRYPMPDEFSNGMPGVMIVPVNSPGGQVYDVRADAQVDGFAVVDDFVRNQAGIDAQTPIWTTISYTHNEDHEAADPKELIGTVLATELRQTHRGAYIGKSITLNSPEGYHSNTWGNRGYHVNVHVWSIDGVDEKLLAHNCYQWGLALNKDVVFPGDYKNDFFAQHSLHNVRDFVAGFLLGDSTFRGPKWATYCAEHITSVENICANVPWNEASFKEFFGVENGAAVYEAAVSNFNAKRASISAIADDPVYDMVVVDEQDFGVPLWKRDQTITDVATEDRVGRGLYYRALSTAELLRDVVSVYYPLDAVMESFKALNPAFAGLAPLTVSGIIQAFREKVVDRTGLASQELDLQADPHNEADRATSPIGAVAPAARFDQLSGPIIALLHAAAEVAEPNALQTAAGAYNSMEEPAKSGGLKLIEQTKAAFGDAFTAFHQCDPSAKEAYDWARYNMRDAMLRAVYAGVAANKVEWNGPPKSSQLVVQNLLKLHPHVHMTAVCTTVDASEVSEKFSKAAFDAAPAAVKKFFEAGSGARMSNVHKPASVADFDAFATAFSARNTDSTSALPAGAAKSMVAVVAVVAAVVVAMLF